MKKWISGKKREVLDAKIFKVYFQQFQSPTMEKQSEFTVIESRNWVNVLPVTKDGDVILVKQFRFGTSEVTYEFPAGIIDDGEEPLEAAKRELLEETGATKFEIKELGSCRPNPAHFNNFCYHFLATGLDSFGDLKLDEHEEIEVIKKSIDEVQIMIDEGIINHSLVLVTWYLYKESLK
jgi:8-oxo-dGTP pyrophosphatase MutT (NUDIX family)